MSSPADGADGRPEVPTTCSSLGCAELVKSDVTRRSIRFHDLRGTGLTWMAMRGHEPLKIQQRAGHTDFATTQGYIREAENLETDVGTPFPALPAELSRESHKSRTGPAERAQLRGNVWKKKGVPSGTPFMLPQIEFAATG